MSFLSDLKTALGTGLSVVSGGLINPQEANTAVSAASSGVQAAESVPHDVSVGVDDAGKLIGSVGDFLSFIAWLFHPLNWLRMVEMVWGTILMGIGLYMLTRRGGSGSVGATARRIVSITPAGREIRMVQGRRMGRHEGQREAARMEARQRETLSQRRESARERVQINRDARRSAP